MSRRSNRTLLHRLGEGVLGHDDGIAPLSTLVTRPSNPGAPMQKRADSKAWRGFFVPNMLETLRRPADFRLASEARFLAQRLARDRGRSQVNGVHPARPSAEGAWAKRNSLERACARFVFVDRPTASSRSAAPASYLLFPLAMRVAVASVADHLHAAGASPAPLRDRNSATTSSKRRRDCSAIAASSRVSDAPNLTALRARFVSGRILA